MKITFFYHAPRKIKKLNVIGKNEQGLIKKIKKICLGLKLTHVCGILYFEPLNAFPTYPVDTPTFIEKMGKKNLKTGYVAGCRYISKGKYKGTYR